MYTLDIVSKYRSTERGTGTKETVHPQNILERQKESWTVRKVYWDKHKGRLREVAGDRKERQEESYQAQACTKVHNSRQTIHWTG